MIRRVLILVGLLFSGVLASYGAGTKDDVDVEYKYNIDFDFQIKLAKGLKLNLSPEFRFNDGYDKLMLDGALSYKTFGCIYWGAMYRLEVDRIDGTYSHETDLYHRYAFDVTYKDKFGRFTPSFRLRYNNFADEDIEDKEYLRYRAKVDYNIRKCKLTPYVAIEAFQKLEDNMLSKMRYSTGFDYKVNKSSSFSLDYKFDLFMLKYKNVNIFSAGYKYRF